MVREVSVVWGLVLEGLAAPWFPCFKFCSPGLTTGYELDIVTTIGVGWVISPRLGLGFGRTARGINEIALPHYSVIFLYFQPSHELVPMHYLLLYTFVLLHYPIAVHMWTAGDFDALTGCSSDTRDEIRTDRSSLTVH